MKIPNRIFIKCNMIKVTLKKVRKVCEVEPARRTRARKVVTPGDKNLILRMMYDDIQFS